MIDKLRPIITIIVVIILIIIVTTIIIIIIINRLQPEVELLKEAIF